MLDGPWGSGKSTLMNLLEDDLVKRRAAEAGWLAIRFDASAASPKWVLRGGRCSCALRTAITPHLSVWQRLRLWLSSRFLLIGKSVLATVAALVIIVAGLGVWIAAAGIRLDLSQSETVIGLLSSIIALAVTLAALATALTRGLSLTTSNRAERLEHSTGDPTKQLVDQLDLLLKSAPSTPLLMIDDLDRCSRITWSHCSTRSRRSSGLRRWLFPKIANRCLHRRG